MSKELDEELDRLLKIAEKISSASIDEGMKKSIFDRMLNKYSLKSKTTMEEQNTQETKGDKLGGGSYTYNNTIKQFLRREGLSEEILEKVFYIENEEVDFAISDIKVKKNKEGLHIAACLVGVKNAIVSGKYNVPLKELRTATEFFGVYDVNNFSQYMKQLKATFRSYKPGEDTILSPTGVKEAAMFINRLAKE